MSVSCNQILAVAVWSSENSTGLVDLDGLSHG